MKNANEPVSKWIAPDGLMSLNPDSRRKGWKGAQETCDNDNGILFLAEYCYTCVPDRANFYKAMTLTRTNEGLFHRNPNRDGYINSHDNYIGMAAACVLFDDRTTFKAVVRSHPFLNNVEHKKPDWEALHQGHNWFCYYLAAGQEPGWFTTIWFILNIIYSTFWYNVANKHSEHKLNWLRSKIVEKSQGLLPKWKQALTNGVLALYLTKRGEDIRTSYLAYYRQEHPVHQAWKTHEL